MLFMLYGLMIVDNDDGVLVLVVDADNKDDAAACCGGCGCGCCEVTT